MTHPAWLKEAEKHVGYREGPNNDTVFGRHFGLNHEPWCDMFVAACCEASGHPLPSMQPGMATGAAAVSYSISYAKAHGLWIPSHEAKVGDQICYGWDGPHSSPEHMHTGFVVSSGPKGSVGHTIEGNRGDAVGRFTFTVGAATVLGCVDLNRLLDGRPKVVIHKPRTKPTPQPRNPHHPSHTGPHPKPHRKAKRMTKPGYKTTEFYSHLIAQVIAILTLVGQFNTSSPLGNALIKLAAVLGSAGAAAGYANARGKAKQPKTT